MERSELSSLARAIASWLSFHHLCGLNGMLRESSLAIPIGTFLGVHSGLELRNEFKHPLFTGDVRGRPKQIDFVLRNRGENLVTAFEAKWADVHIKELIYDLYRLESLSTLEFGRFVRRYFLVAGTTNQVQGLELRKVNAGGGCILLRDFLLSFDLDEPSRTFEAEKAPGVTAKYLRDFELAYYPNPTDARMPSKIKTILKANNGTEGFRVLVWEIQRMQGVGCVRLSPRSG